MILLKHNGIRWMFAGIALTTLLVIYLFQKFDFSETLGIYSPNARFIINKSIRFLVNDISCLLLITAIFNKLSYLRLSTWVFLIELFVMLPLYFAIKLTIEGDSEISSPLLSQWHRMIVNPLLMIILMFGFWYQEYFSKKS